MPGEFHLSDGLDGIELLCKAYRALAILICECHEDLQDKDREGVCIILDNLTDRVEGYVRKSWDALPD